MFRSFENLAARIGAFPAALLITAIVLGVSLFVISLSNSQSEPEYSATTIAELHYEMDTYESLAALSKRRSDAIVGQRLYNKAMAAQNRVLVAKIVGVIAKDGEPDNALDDWVTDADNKKLAFYNWYIRADAAETDTFESSHAIPDLILSSLVDLVRIQEARAQEIRQVVRDELRDCQWRAWSEL